MRWLASIRLSPDGRLVAAVETRLDRRSDGLRSRLSVWAVGAGRPVLRTAWSRAVRSPAWSPDGLSLAAVIVGRAGEAVCLFEVDGWTAQPVPLSLASVDDLAWRPGTTQLSLSAMREERGEPGRAWRVRRIIHKADGAPVADRITGREQFVLDLRTGEATPIPAAGTVNRRGVWSHDGQQLAFLSDAGRPGGVGIASSIWTWVPGAAAPHPVVGALGPVTALAWAGDDLAFIGHQSGNDPAVNHQLWALAGAAGAPRSLTSEFDRSLGVIPQADDPRGYGDTRLEVSPDGRQFYVRFADGMTGRLARIDRHGRVTPIGRDRETCLDVSVSSSGELATLVGTPDALGDIWVDGPSGQRRVTDVNPWLRRRRLAPTERVRATGPNATPVEGLLLRPPDAAGPVPLVVSIHGGPHYPAGWRFWFEGQRLAAQGYAVLVGNPRGSGGYGSSFTGGIRDDWGGADLADVLALVEAAAAEPGIDGSRAAVTGVSYGAYLSVCAIAAVDRFTAAIAENGVYDLASAFVTAEDAGAGFDGELTGAPWGNLEAFTSRSPIWRAADIRTPLLLIHAEQDHGCPIEQSVGLFVALRRLDRPVEMLRIPDEGHLVNLVGRPSHRVERAAAIDAWLGRWLGAAPTAAL